jgi:hypothetical protein
MFRFGLILIVVGGVLGWLGIKEWRLSSGASDKPKQVTLKDLIAQGPGDNAHIVLMDFVLCENLVYQSNKNSTTWSKAWIPIVPKPSGGEQVISKPTSFHAILYCPNVKNQVDAASLANRPTLKGMVINDIESLGAEETKLLKQTYPNTDFDKCLIIEPDREPAGFGKIVLFMGGGALLLVGGLVAMLVSFRGRAR